MEKIGKHGKSAVILALGLSLCTLETMATGEQNGGRESTAGNAGKIVSVSGNGMETVSGNGAESIINMEQPDSIVSERMSLQIPQRLGVVIDPWELAGRGQIYSEQYMIRNMGDAPGTLTLSFRCISGEDREVNIRTDKEGLHEETVKSICMEMVYEDGNRIALSQEGGEYRIELQPKEQFLVWFSGEVNENASEQWRDGDVTVEGRYSWDIANNMSFQEYTGKNLKTDEQEGVEGTYAGVSGNDPGAENRNAHASEERQSEICIDGSGK